MIDLHRLGLAPLEGDALAGVRIVQHPRDNHALVTAPEGHLRKLPGQHGIATVAPVMPTRTVMIVGPRGPEHARLTIAAPTLVTAGPRSLGHDPNSG
ncbi:hypothetical protein JMUB6875_11560 [Nocardia sp. JMUB6875]